MSSQSNILLNKIITTVVKSGAARLHLEVGSKPIVRIDQKLQDLPVPELITAEFLRDTVDIILSETEKKELIDHKSCVITHTFEGNIRFKIHIFYQKENLAMIFTYVPVNLSRPEDLNLTPEFIDLVNQKKGLIIVGGYHGSGRTSTVMSLLNHVNISSSKYILTVENPIEYILTADKSIIEQREIGRDANDFLAALNFCEESDVDIIFLSEIDSYDVLKSVINLIYSGRLVIVITQADSVADSIARLIEIAPEPESDKIRHEIADVLLGAVVQQLVPRRGGGEITVNEILITNSAAVALIKEGRYSQLLSIIQTSRAEGMRSLDQILLEYLKTDEIDYHDAMQIAVNKADFQSAASRFASRV